MGHVNRAYVQRKMIDELMEHVRAWAPEKRCHCEGF